MKRGGVELDLIEPGAFDAGANRLDGVLGGIVALAGLKASGDPKNREAVRSALSKLTVDTLVGKVDFANAKVPGIALTPLAGGQWRKRGGKYKYDLVVTFNESTAPFKIEDEFKLLSQLS